MYTSVFLKVAAKAHRQKKPEAYAPTITDPLPVVVDELQPFTLTVTAEGNPTPTYQWYKGGTAIIGATGSSYTVNVASITDIGNYYCIALNPVGSAQSATVSVLVNPVLREIGEIYTKSTFSNTTGFEILNNAAVTSGGKLVFSGGVGLGDFSRSVRVMAFEDPDEKMTAMQEFTLTDADGGISLGKKSTNPWFHVSIAGQFDAETGEVSLWRTGDVGILKYATSTGSVTVTVGAKYRLSFRINVDAATATIARIDNSGNVLETASITAPFVFINQVFSNPNTSSFALYTHGGGQSVSYLNISRQSRANIDILYVGDSKTNGVAVAAADLRYSTLSATELGLSYEILGGNGDRTVELLKYLDLIILLNPKVVSICIGRNDEASNEGGDAFHERYDFIISTLKNAGIRVVIVLPIPEPNYNQDSVYNFQHNTYAGDWQVNPAINWNNSTMVGNPNSDDSIHQNTLGHRHIADAFKEQVGDEVVAYINSLAA